MGRFRTFHPNSFMNPINLPLRITLFIRACLAIACLVFCCEPRAQNLVVNPGFESGLTGFTTDYTLWAGQPGWGPDLYYITNNPHKAYTGNALGGWIDSGDHTTGSGRMLIVDGSNTAGKVFWRQTLTVEPNTTYVFSAWALKFDHTIPPILYFTVNGAMFNYNGTIQGTFHVLPIAPSGWIGYGVTWHSGVATTALLELRLQSTLGPGNNLAVDDVSFVRAAEIPDTPSLIETAAQVSWKSHPGVAYQAYWASELEPQNWLPLGDPVLGNGLTNSISDPFQGRPRRFYKVQRVE